MEKRRFTDPKIRMMESGALQAYRGVLDCNSCHHEIDGSNDYFFFTCADTCDYDICLDCLTCPAGKQLYKAFKPYDELE